MAPSLASNEETAGGSPSPGPRVPPLWGYTPAAQQLCLCVHRPGQGRAEQRTWVACQEAPSGTALDGHFPVPALGWTEAFCDGERLVRHAFLRPSRLGTGLGPVQGEVRNVGP